MARKLEGATVHPYIQILLSNKYLIYKLWSYSIFIQYTRYQVYNNYMGGHQATNEICHNDLLFVNIVTVIQLLSHQIINGQIVNIIFVNNHT